jgi:hypothetical protein
VQLRGAGCGGSGTPSAASRWGSGWCASGGLEYCVSGGLGGKERGPGRRRTGRRGSAGDCGEGGPAGLQAETGCKNRRRRPPIINRLPQYAVYLKGRKASTGAAVFLLAVWRRGDSGGWSAEGRGLASGASRAGYRLACQGGCRWCGSGGLGLLALVGTWARRLGEATVLRLDEAGGWCVSERLVLSIGEAGCCVSDGLGCGASGRPACCASWRLGADGRARGFLLWNRLPQY